MCRSVHPQCTIHPLLPVLSLPSMPTVYYPATPQLFATVPLPNCLLPCHSPIVCYPALLQLLLPCCSLAAYSRPARLQRVTHPPAYQQGALVSGRQSRTSPHCSYPTNPCPGSISSPTTSHAAHTCATATCSTEPLHHSAMPASPDDLGCAFTQPPIAQNPKRGAPTKVGPPPGGGKEGPFSPRSLCCPDSHRPSLHAGVTTPAVLSQWLCWQPHTAALTAMGTPRLCHGWREAASGGPALTSHAVLQQTGWECWYA
jgi:hypothetical protein